MNTNFLRPRTTVAMALILSFCLPAFSPAWAQKDGLTPPPKQPLTPLGGNASTNINADYFGSDGSQEFVFKMNGVERLRLPTTGGLGLGTDTPGKRLSGDNDARIPENIDPQPRAAGSTKPCLARNPSTS